MTRKRLVKILMGKGLPRNYANDVAETLRKCKIPYSRKDCVIHSAFCFDNAKCRYYIWFLFGGAIRLEKHMKTPFYLVPLSSLKLENGFTPNYDPPYFQFRTNTERIKKVEPISQSIKGLGLIWPSFIIPPYLKT